tara:strand:+ start:542 stop:733 length:192 start_codon:yes stop_codon:yes gene_type:complete
MPKESKEPSLAEEYWLEWLTAFGRIPTKKQLQEFVGMMEDQIGETIINSDVLDGYGMKTKGTK